MHQSEGKILSIPEKGGPRGKIPVDASDNDRIVWGVIEKCKPLTHIQREIFYKLLFGKVGLDQVRVFSLEGYGLGDILLAVNCALDILDTEEVLKNMD